MKKRTAMAFILALSMLAGCTSNEKTRETKETSDDTEATTEATEETETTATTETEPSDEPVSEPREARFARDVHETGSIKDGVYLASGLVFDEDNSGLTADIYEYVSLDERDCSDLGISYFVNFENCCHGDFYENLDKPDYISTYNVYYSGMTDSESNIHELNNEGWFLKEQADGSYYVFDPDEEPLVYPYEEQMNLKVSEDVVIYGYADVFSNEGIKLSDISYKYDDIESYIDTMKYATEAGKVFNTHIVVEDGVITEMYVAPLVLNGDIVLAHNSDCENGIPDGDYYAGSYSIDSDFNGMKLELRDYSYFTKDDVEQLKKGDYLVTRASEDEYDFVTGKQSSFNFMQITEEPNIGEEYVSLGNDYDLSLQPDGQYYLMWNGLICGVPVIENDVHINTSSDLVIMDNADVYCSDGIHTDSNTITYDTLKSFSSALEDDCVWYTPAIHVIIKNGKISEIYINPEQHQPWRE